MREWRTGFGVGQYLVLVVALASAGCAVVDDGDDEEEWVSSSWAATTTLEAGTDAQSDATTDADATADAADAADAAAMCHYETCGCDVRFTRGTSVCYAPAGGSPICPANVACGPTTAVGTNAATFPVQFYLLSGCTNPANNKTLGCEILPATDPRNCLCTNNNCSVDVPAGCTLTIHCV